MRQSILPPLTQRLLGCCRVLALCWGLCVVAGARAVENSVLPEVVLRNWDLNDGLPSARINALVRTADGYLWLATHKGLVCFDGNRFLVFDAANTPGMKDERASCLLLDRRGDLWAGTYGGTLLKREGLSFRAQDLGVAAPPHLEHDPATGKVNALAEDRQGAIWLALEGRGLLRFHQGRVETFGTSSGLPHENVKSVLCDAQGQLWAVAEGRLCRFEAGSWRVAPGLRFDAQTVRTISPARDGGLWVVTAAGLVGNKNSRLYKLKEGRWSAQVEAYPWPEDSEQFQRFALLEDHSGRVWCATTGGVFSRPPAGLWQPLASVAPWVQVEVLCLAEDEEGSLWMGTRTTGLVQVQRRQVMSHPLPEAENHHAVLTACATRDGGLWCGTDGAGLFRWHGEQLAHFGAEEGLSNLSVLALLEDRHTNLWAGTLGGLFRRVGERFEAVPGVDVLRRDVRALLEDSQGRLWAAARGRLVRLHGADQQVFRAEEGVPWANIRALAEDRQHRLWVGTTERGLYRQAGERFQRCPLPPELQTICALHCDAAGAMWIGTDQAGLLRFQGEHWEQWLWSPDGLPSNHITAILEDEAGELWMSSENGIFGCSKAALDRYRAGATPRLQPTRLTVAEGLAHKVCSGVGHPVACKSADGRLWFPNGPALAAVEPRALARAMRVWPPLIEGARVDGVATGPLAAGLRVPSGARRIDFQYTSPNTLAPERLRFRFRLDGLDQQWVEAGARREASYSRLPPGQYQFRVMASGPDDVWQEGRRGLPVEILPQFWERRAFQIAAGLLLLAGVAALAWAVERSRSRRRLERLELQRTLDNERQRIARDIHDDLGSGLTEIILLSDSLDEALLPTPADQQMAAEISARARSLTRAMEEVVWAINPRNDTLEGFLVYLGKFTQDYLARAGIRCRWNVPLEVPELPLSAEMRHSLYLVCKEALHNVVKHAHAAEVSVGLDLSDEAFTLTIEDDGQGFAVEAPRRGGNGLTNMRQRLEELSGRCWVESHPGRGTRVLLWLPGALKQRLAPSLPEACPRR